MANGISNPSKTRTLAQNVINNLLQVYCGDQFIGWLNVNFPSKEGTIYVGDDCLSPVSFNGNFMNAPMTPVQAPEFFHINVRKRNVLISEFDLQMHGQDYVHRVMAEHRVPPNHVKAVDQMSGDMRYSWLAADVSLDLSETIFDLDKFIPYDE